MKRLVAVLLHQPDAMSGVASSQATKKLDGRFRRPRPRL